MLATFRSRSPLAAGSDRKCSTLRRIVIMDAHDLQSIENNFFVFEHADSGLPDGIEIFRGAGELLVVAGDEVRAQRRGKFSPGFGQPREIHGGPVKHVARDKQHVRAQLRKFPDDAAEKAGVSHVAEMQVAHEGGGAAAPGGWKIGQLDGDAHDARPRRIHDGANAREKAETKAHGRERALFKMHSKQERHAIDDPACACGKKKEIHEAQPDRGDRCRRPGPAG